MQTESHLTKKDLVIKILHGELRVWLLILRLQVLGEGDFDRFVHELDVFEDAQHFCGSVLTLEMYLSTGKVIFRVVDVDHLLDGLE